MGWFCAVAIAAITYVSLRCVSSPDTHYRGNPIHVGHQMILDGSPRERRHIVGQPVAVLTCDEDEVPATNGDVLAQLRMAAETYAAAVTRDWKWLPCPLRMPTNRNATDGRGSSAVPFERVVNVTTLRSHAPAGMLVDAFGADDKRHWVAVKTASVRLAPVSQHTWKGMLSHFEATEKLKSAATRLVALHCGSVTCFACINLGGAAPSGPATNHTSQVLLVQRMVRLVLESIDLIRDGPGDAVKALYVTGGDAAASMVRASMPPAAALTGAAIVSHDNIDSIRRLSPFERAAVDVEVCSGAVTHVGVAGSLLGEWVDSSRKRNTDPSVMVEPVSGDSWVRMRHREFAFLNVQHDG